MEEDLQTLAERDPGPGVAVWRWLLDSTGSQVKSLAVLPLIKTVTIEPSLDPCLSK